MTGSAISDSEIGARREVPVPLPAWGTYVRFRGLGPSTNFAGSPTPHYYVMPYMGGVHPQGGSGGGWGAIMVDVGKAPTGWIPECPAHIGTKEFDNR